MQTFARIINNRSGGVKQNKLLGVTQSLFFIILSQNQQNYVVPVIALPALQKFC
tara:strand:- start:8 stop:169 length:162 start_codon:yes stop_codon:yes gene_type:complete